MIAFINQFKMYKKLLSKNNTTTKQNIQCGHYLTNRKYVKVMNHVNLEGRHHPFFQDTTFNPLSRNICPTFWLLLQGAGHKIFVCQHVQGQGHFFGMQHSPSPSRCSVSPGTKFWLLVYRARAGILVPQNTGPRSFIGT